MSTQPQDGGPAFPVQEQLSGVSLLDYMATAVSFGEDDYMPTGESMIKLMGRNCPSAKDDPLGYLRFHAEYEALIRYGKARAMLAEREKEAQP